MADSTLRVGWTVPRLTRTLQLRREGLLPGERLVGESATSRAEVDDLFRRVAGGALVPTAAMVDWSFAGE